MQGWTVTMKYGVTRKRSTKCFKHTGNMEVVYFWPLSSKKFLVLILSTTEGWKAELTLQPPNSFEHRLLDLESSTLTATSMLHKLPIFKQWAKSSREDQLSCIFVFSAYPTITSSNQEHQPRNGHMVDL